MSINGATLVDGTPVFVQNEKLFHTFPGVKLKFESGNGYPGQGNNFFSNSGVLYLTNLRVIYVTVPEMSLLKSFNIPLDHMNNGKLIQPWFDANRYEAVVYPVINGGLSEPGQIQFIFKEGGGFEFSAMFLQLRSRMTGEQQHEEPLPLYSQNASSSSSSASAPPNQTSSDQCSTLPPENELPNYDAKH